MNIQYKLDMLKVLKHNNYRRFCFTSESNKFKTILELFELRYEASYRLNYENFVNFSKLCMLTEM